MRRSQQHSYRPHVPPGNMEGKCSALVRPSVRGDRMLPCLEELRSPVHTVLVIPIDDPLAEMLRAARQRWKELADAGTPYWCTHGYSVIDQPAYSWPDTPGDPIYKSHGVRCAECGGYIQEG